MGFDRYGGYNGLDPEGGSGRNSLASHVLSNGETIWDLSGNVAEWVGWTVNFSNFDLGPTTCNNAWTEIPLFNCAALAAADYMPGNPAGIPAADYTSASYSIGAILGGTGGAGMRGGYFNLYEHFNGIFALELNTTPTASRTWAGFRCVYRP